jgi:uncharacterized protein YjbJ (UPF0337 family)
MTVNHNQSTNKWPEIREDLQKSWGKLTDSDLDKTKGDVRAISGLIQEKYGESQDTYRKKVTDIIAKFEAKKEDPMKNSKNLAKR